MTVHLTWSSILFLLISTQKNFVTSVQPGDACPNGNECNDILTFLECNPTTKTCDCQDPAISYWEDPGTRCHRFLGESCTDLGMPCPLNGACDTSTVPSASCACSAPQGFIATPGGKCAKNFGATCTAEWHCDRDSFVMCRNASCGCNDFTSTFDPETKQCVLKIDQPCSMTAGAQLCGEWLVCDTTCQCMDGLVANGDGQCRLGLGAECADGEEGEPTCDETASLVCDPVSHVCVVSTMDSSKWSD